MRIRKSAPLGHSLGPAVETVRVCTNVVKSHLSLRLLRVGLEKHGLSVAALGAGMVLRSGQGWVGHHVSDNVGDGVHFVHDLVNINTTAVSHLPIVAVPAGVQQDLV